MNRDEALEKKAENARELGLDYEPDPVAWGVFEGKLHDMFFTEAEAIEMAQLKGTHAEVRPLYTAPQRTWVELTDHEIEMIYAVTIKVRKKDIMPGEQQMFAKTIQHFLKERNT